MAATGMDLSGKTCFQALKGWFAMTPGLRVSKRRAISSKSTRVSLPKAVAWHLLPDSRTLQTVRLPAIQPVKRRILAAENVA